MMDEFSATRLKRVVEGFRARHGRDISERELRAAGFEPAQIDAGVRHGLLQKHQVTTGKGATENRFRIAKDWKSLNT